MFTGFIFIYLIWFGFVAIVLYAFYRVLDKLLDKYLVVKHQQNTLFREFIEVMKEKKD